MQRAIICFACIVRVNADIFQHCSNIHRHLPPESDFQFAFCQKKEVDDMVCQHIQIIFLEYSLSHSRSEKVEKYCLPPRKIFVIYLKPIFMDTTIDHSKDGGDGSSLFKK